MFTTHLGQGGDSTAHLQERVEGLDGCKYAGDIDVVHHIKLLWVPVGRVEGDSTSLAPMWTQMPCWSLPEQSQNIGAEQHDGQEWLVAHRS